MKGLSALLEGALVIARPVVGLVGADRENWAGVIQGSRLPGHCLTTATRNQNEGHAKDHTEADAVERSHFLIGTRNREKYPGELDGLRKPDRERRRSLRADVFAYEPQGAKT